MIKTKKIKTLRSNGFTLIELLVVIAILGLLASIIMVAMNSARIKARDARRKADFKQLSTGLEMFYNEYGKYPCGDASGSCLNKEGIYVSCQSDYSGSFPFLDGNAATDLVTAYGYDASYTPHHGNNSECDSSADAPTFGLYTAGIVGNKNYRDPTNNVWPYQYAYATNAERTKYIIVGLLENDMPAMANDGGLCNNYYEIGTWKGELNLNAWLSKTCN